MESIITSYNIDYEQLRLFIADYNGFIAGSAALAAYFKQENIPVKYEPGDIDIWIPTDEPEFIQLFQEFIRIYGFTNSHEYDTIRLSHCEMVASYGGVFDYNDVPSLLSVNSFLNCSEQKVQLIIINPENYHSMREYIWDHFDISVCATWWNPCTQVITTIDENNTKKMRMYILNKKNIGDGKERVQKRLVKYKERGFKYITSQPQVYDSEDPRIFTTNKLSMEVATDIITFEDDINVQQFLEASHDNIIVKCGTQLYAFNRKYITDYMHKHTGYIINNRESGFTCTTPFNQTILRHDVNYIDYCDYSIYEFVYSHVVHHGGKSYSICKMNCYTVANWEKDTVVPSRVCNAPYASLAPLPRAPINIEVMV
jgi:hypothetical protein